MQKNIKILNRLIPLLLMIVGTVALAYIIKDRTSAMDFSRMGNLLINNPTLVFVIFLLMVPNWFIELTKWKNLAQKYVKLDFRSSLKSILAGIGFSIFTPNRIGDLGGRVLYVEKQEKFTCFYLTFLCSCSQLLVTILIGSAGLFYFGNVIFADFLLTDPSIFLSIVVAVNFLILMLFLNLEKLRRIYTWALPQKILQNGFLPIVSKTEKLQLLLWSFARYQIFFVQFFLLMVLFGSDIGFIECYFGLSLVYLLTSFLPTSVISEIPIRGSVAYFVFAYLEMNAGAASASFIMMWIINLFIPASFSLVLLKEVKYPAFSNAKLV